LILIWLDATYHCHATLRLLLRHWCWCRHIITITPLLTLRCHYAILILILILITPLIIHWLAFISWHYAITLISLMTYWLIITLLIFHWLMLTLMPLLIHYCFIDAILMPTLRHYCHIIFDYFRWLFHWYIIDYWLLTLLLILPLIFSILFFSLTYIIIDIDYFLILLPLLLIFH
jgi:hypothetical protein